MQQRIPEIITCASCGVCFERQPRGRRPKRCTQCTATRRRLAYEAQPHVCKTCGVEVQRRVANGPYPEYCPPCKKGRRLAQRRNRPSQRRARPPRPRRPDGSCADCGCVVPSKRGDPARRCPACTVEHTRKLALKVGRECSDCGQRFTYWTRYWTKRCEPCHAMWRVDLQRSKNVSRRMRLANVPYEFLSRARVFAEDGWVCGLCNQSVDPALRWPDGQSATLDHIVPVSRGGGHVRSNVQLAHAICNSRKGASPLTALGDQHG